MNWVKLEMLFNLVRLKWKQFQDNLKKVKENEVLSPTGERHSVPPLALFRESAGDEHGRARCKEGHDGGGVREGRGSQYPAACAMRSSEKAPGRLGERAVRLCGWLAVV